MHTLTWWREIKRKVFESKLKGPVVEATHNCGLLFLKPGWKVVKLVKIKAAAVTMGICAPVCDNVAFESQGVLTRSMCGQMQAVAHLHDLAHYWGPGLCTSLTLCGSDIVIMQPNKLHPRASIALLTSQGMTILGPSPARLPRNTEGQTLKSSHKDYHPLLSSLNPQSHPSENQLPLPFSLLIHFLLLYHFKAIFFSSKDFCLGAIKVWVEWLLCV